MQTTKAIKDKYKQIEFPMGVFQVKCTENEKCYAANCIDMDSKSSRQKMALKSVNQWLKQVPILYKNNSGLVIKTKVSECIKGLYLTEELMLQKLLICLCQSLYLNQDEHPN